MKIEQITTAVENGKNWLLNNQITSETESYDMIRFLDEGKTKAEWYTIPVPEYLFGAYYSNLVKGDPYGKPEDCRRQYYNTWHTAQAGVALLEYLDYKEDAAVRRSVDLAWKFIDRQQLKSGEYAGVFVEFPVEKLEYPLFNRHSFGHNSPEAKNSYADYDNIETDLFPLEYYRRTKERKYLECAMANADFYLNKHPEIIYFETETGNYSISGMCNDAIYGRMFEYTGDEKYREIFARQVRAMNFLGLDLRAGNNVRNMYWDCTLLTYAIEKFPELFGPAMAKLAFISEHTLSALRDEGCLAYRFSDAGVPDINHPRCRDGAASYAMVRPWGVMYEITGDQRWLDAIHRVIKFSLTQQYPAGAGKEFAGAFVYAGTISHANGSYESLRDISTIFALRVLLPVIKGSTKWAKDLNDKYCD